MNPPSSHSTPLDFDKFLANADGWAQATRSLQRIARAIVGDEASAEDVVQSAWLESWQSKSVGRSISRNMGWMRTLVRSRSLDVVRKRRRESDKLEAAHLQQSSGPIESQIELQRAVLEVVNALPEPYRTTIYWRYFEDLSTAEIAERLGLRLPTVKTRLTRAHAMLRERLAEHHRSQNGAWAPALLALAASAQKLPSSTTALGAPLLLMKPLWISIAAVLILLGGWFVYQGFEQSPVDAVEPETERSAGGEFHAQLTAPTSSESVLEERSILAKESATITARKSGTVGGSLRVAVFDSQGLPAPGIHVILRLDHESTHLQRLCRVLADDSGIALFEKLPPGGYRLRSDRHRYEEKAPVEILEGVETSARLEIPKGFRVKGRVVDGDKRPVPQAKIWLTSRAQRWTRGVVVGEADPKGYFELLEIPEGESIGAIADGFEPSELVDMDLQDKSREPVMVEIVLLPGGAELYGMVTDLDGAPLSQARVTVGDNRRYGRMRGGGSFSEEWSARTAVTDVTGAYRFVGLPSGTHMLQVRAASLALWGSEVTLAAGAHVNKDITLDQGVQLSGRVTQIEGGPVPNATILVFPKRLNERYLQGGQVDNHQTLLGPAAVTDENGMYELFGVASGKQFLYALEPRKKENVLYHNIRYAKESRALVAGTKNDWSPVLSDGDVIEGRALYRDGEPIQETFIILTGPKPKESRVYRSEDGTFQFKNLDKGAYKLRVQMFELPEGHQEPQVEPVEPGGPPIDLIATFDSPVAVTEAIIRVRFIDTSDPSKAGVQVQLERCDGNSSYFGKEKEGVWTFKISDPGKYRPVAVHADRVLAVGEEVDIKGGETLRLPDLQTGPSGTLVLDIQGSAESRMDKMRSFLRMEGTFQAEEVALTGQTEIRMENMMPGSGTLSVRGTRVLQLDLEFTIQAGKETILPVTLTPAVAVPYRITWPIGEGTGTLDLQFIDRATGNTVDSFETKKLGKYNSPIQWSTFLTPGSYRFVVTKDGHPYHEENFEVTSLDQELAPKVGMR